MYLSCHHPSLSLKLTNVATVVLLDCSIKATRRHCTTNVVMKRVHFCIETAHNMNKAFERRLE